MTHYKGTKTVEENFVETIVPPGGLVSRLYELYEFHSRHGIRPQRGPLRRDAKCTVIRWFFADPMQRAILSVSSSKLERPIETARSSRCLRIFDLDSRPSTALSDTAHPFL